MIETSTLLTPQELSRCDRVGTRLQAELESVLAALPTEVSTVRAIEAHLGINRNVCQRIKACVGKRRDARGALLLAPGVAGLKSFVQAFLDHGGEPSIAAAASSAIHLFEELIRELGGSQTKLNARVKLVGNSAKEPPTESSILQARRTRFEADIQLLGIGVGTNVILDVFRPLPDDPSQVEHVFVIGYHGVRTFYDGMPIVNLMLLGSGPESKTRVFTLDGEPLGENPTGVVVEEFSSKPLPEVTTRGSGKRSLLVFDPDTDPSAPPFDLVFARHMSPAGTNPVLEAEPLLVRTITMRYPARRLVNDVWLHKSMAESCQASGDVLFKSNTSRERRERWYDSLPHGPKVHAFAVGELPPKLPDLAGQEALAIHVFKQLGWDMADFGCFRMQVEYPLTGPEYGVVFDFSTEAEDPDED